MPRFRITRPLPPCISYRNRQCLIFEARPAANAWTVFARKDLPPGHWEAAALWSAYSEVLLEQAGKDGFEVAPGSAAERVMLSLVRLGAAEAL